MRKCEKFRFCVLLISCSCWTVYQEKLCYIHSWRFSRQSHLQWEAGLQRLFPNSVSLVFSLVLWLNTKQLWLPQPTQFLKTWNSEFSPPNVTCCDEILKTPRKRRSEFPLFLLYSPLELVRLINRLCVYMMYMQSYKSLVQEVRKVSSVVDFRRELDTCRDFEPLLVYKKQKKILKISRLLYIIANVWKSWSTPQ